MATKCLLRSLDSSYCDITIWNDDPATIGRSVFTKIKDKRCSKNQVELRCSLLKHKCRVTQVGSNASVLQGQELQQGVAVTAEHSHVIEVLAGCYKYRIEFDPSPSINAESEEKSEESDVNDSSKNSINKYFKPLDTKRKANSKSDLTASNRTQDSAEQQGGGNSRIPLRQAEANDTKAEMPARRKNNSDSSGSTKRLADDDLNGSEVKKAKQTTETSATDVPSSKNAGQCTWTSIAAGDLLVYNADGLPGSSKVACYDMDGTLITTQSGKVFAKDYNDWKIIFSEVPGKLKSLHSQGYKIVIFTNQAGIGTGKQTAVGIKGKIVKVMSRLGVPMQALVSTAKGRYRKPTTAMWEYFEQHCNGGVAVDRTKSLYVGDAAGRPEVAKQRKKDHSSADRLFALNLDLPFKTPEEHFLSRKTEVYKLPEFDPRSMPLDLPLYDPKDATVPAHTTEMVVMVGFPGSGKSVVATRSLGPLGYVHINRDVVGTWQKCVALAQKSLKAGQSVVVDNTNPDRESRSRYIKVATELKVPVRCFVLNVTKDHSRHNNKFRELTDPNHSKVSDMIFHMYNSKFQSPDKSEGFYDIVKVNFVPKFDDSGDEKLYKMFLLEK